MKKLLLLIVIIAQTFNASSQSFYKYVNDPNIAGSAFFSCIATSSGYQFVGSANNLIFDSHLFFAKVSTTGTLQQMRSFPSGGFNSFTSALQTVDGKFAYFGNEMSNTTFIGTLVLIKTDLVGNYLINKTYSDPAYSFASTKMIQDGQGNYYLLATANNNQTFQSRICILKLDATGAIVDQKYISHTSDLSAMDIIPTSSGILVSGYANNGSSIETIALISLDLSFNIQWSKWFSNSSINYFHYDIKEKSSGNYLLCGRYDDGSTPFNALVMEIDNAGNQVWAKKYTPNNNTACYGYALQLTTGGDAIIGGSTNSSPGMGAALAMSVNASNGNLNWSKLINSGTSNEVIYDMRITTAGDIIACGTRDGNAAIIKTDASFDLCADSAYTVTESNITLSTAAFNPVVSGASLTSGNWSLTPTAFTTLGDACLGVGISPEAFVPSFQVYPNPANNIINIQSETQIEKITISNTLGQVGYSLNMNSDTKAAIDVSALEPGIYFIQLQSGNTISAEKFVKSK